MLKIELVKNYELFEEPLNEYITTPTSANAITKGSSFTRYKKKLEFYNRGKFKSPDITRKFSSSTQNNSARRIARVFRTYQSRNRSSRSMAFIINLYNNILDLTNIDNRKLLQEGCVGLKELDKFSGKKLDFANFEKLMEKSFFDVKVMEAFMIPTK